MKALGTGWRNGIAWTDIGVANEPSGKPVLTLSGRCLEIAGELGIREWHLSLSHAGGARHGATRGYAVASVIGCGAGGNDGRRTSPSEP